MTDYKCKTRVSLTTSLSILLLLGVIFHLDIGEYDANINKCVFSGSVNVAL